MAARVNKAIDASWPYSFSQPSGERCAGVPSLTSWRTCCPNDAAWSVMMLQVATRAVWPPISSCGRLRRFSRFYLGRWRFGHADRDLFGFELFFFRKRDGQHAILKRGID